MSRSLGERAGAQDLRWTRNKAAHPQRWGKKEKQRRTKMHKAMSQTTKHCSCWSRGWWEAGEMRTPQRAAWDRGKPGSHGVGLGRLTQGRTGTQCSEGHPRRHLGGSTQGARQHGRDLLPSCREDMAAVRDAPSSKPTHKWTAQTMAAQHLTTRTNTPKSHPAVEEKDTQPETGRSHA